MYLDTSVIIKLLVPETDSAFFDQHVSGQALSTSELAWTEVFSALRAKERCQLITAGEGEKAWRRFGSWVESGQIKMHPLNSLVLKRANHLIARCHPAVPIRALDAIHTAACDQSQDFPLCTNDRRMRDAAGILGIPLFPTSDAS
jgi:predicted nucleic acid-binding protein